MSARALLILLAAMACDGSASPGDAGAPAADAGATEAGTAVDAGATEAGVASPLAAQAEVLDFKCVKPGDAFGYPVNLENRGGAPVGPLAVQLGMVVGATLDLLSDGCSGLVLPAGESCRVNLFFMAPAPVTVSTTLTVSAPGTPPLVLPVRAQVSSSCP